MVDFNVMEIPDNELALIGLIARRAAMDLGVNFIDTQMDLTVVHFKNPLRLGEFLESDGKTFSHDIAGIACHLDRETGELLDCFLPKMIAPLAPEAA